ncbi:hypothetical protein CW713_04390 [Methanophagales archaeon]|nr:MAG: hypothetical protein CW713_04390 [Methanophagales archaeon]
MKVTQHFFSFTKNVFASQKPLLKIPVSLVKLYFLKKRFVLKEKQIIFSFLAQVLSLEKKESVVLIS